MAKAIDKAGIPVVHITNLQSVSKVTGANRILPGIAIDNPCCDATLSGEQRQQFKKRFMRRALQALATEVNESRIF